MGRCARSVRLVAGVFSITQNCRGLIYIDAVRTETALELDLSFMESGSRHERNQNRWYGLRGP